MPRSARRLLARDLRVPVGDLAVGLLQLALGLVPGGDQRAHLAADGVELRLGLGEGHAERLLIEREEDLARLDLGVVVHVHLVDAAGDLRRDLGDVRLDVGILGA